MQPECRVGPVRSRSSIQVGWLRVCPVLPDEGWSLCSRASKGICFASGIQDSSATVSSETDLVLEKNRRDLPAQPRPTVATMSAEQASAKLRPTGRGLHGGAAWRGEHNWKQSAASQSVKEKLVEVNGLRKSPIGFRRRFYFMTY